MIIRRSQIDRYLFAICPDIPSLVLVLAARRQLRLLTLNILTQAGFGRPWYRRCTPMLLLLLLLLLLR